MGKGVRQVPVQDLPVPTNAGSGILRFASKSEESYRNADIFLKNRENAVWDIY